MKSVAEVSHTAKPAQANQLFFPEKGEPTFFAPTRVQAKMTVNTPGDTLEKEADATANKVMRSALAPNITKKEEEIQRKCTDCEQKEEPSSEKPQISRRETSGSGQGGQAVPHIVGEVVSSTGHGLDSGTRTFMETGFGRDFSEVRIHTDSKAAQSAQAISAHAYTYQNHIVFDKGQYAPHTDSGKTLLAHELTHVVQQSEQVQRKISPGSTRTANTRKKQNLAPINRPGNLSGVKPSRPNPGPSYVVPVSPGPGIAPTARSGEPHRKENRGTPEPTPAIPESAISATQSSTEEAAGPKIANLREPLMPSPPETLSPASEQRLEQAGQRATASATAHTTLPSDSEQTAGARAAVQEPTQETQARASGDLISALDQRPQPSPEIIALCDHIREAIREHRPPDEDSLLRANPEAAANEAGSQLNQNIQGDADRVTGDYQQINEQPSGTPEQIAQPLTQPPMQADAPAINAEQATPDAVPDEAVSLEADTQRTARQMQDAGMNSAAAQLVQTGPIAEARAAQGELEQTAQQDPAVVLAQQQETLTNARTSMLALQQSALHSLENSRTRTITASTQQQTGMVETEEERRRQIAAQAESIFTTAQTQVNELLQPLTTTAMAMWEAGKTRIATEFRQHLDRVQRWVDERHSGLGGGLVEVWDDWTGLPDWVTDNYNEAERIFGDSICSLITEISAEVNSVIATCEQHIDKADRDITDLYASQPGELATWAAEEQARFRERFTGLRTQVTQTQQNFTRDLTDNAAQTVQEVRQEVHALREKAKGILGRFADAFMAFLEDPLRTIINGLLSLVNIEPARFWALVDRIAQVIGQIVEDPLGFASNLLSAIGDGFGRFFTNIGTHLFNGLLEWLFSGLGSVGVQIPRELSLPNIITFFLQLMGITWDRIRRLLARHIGEENVALIEQAYQIVSDLIEMGPEGIFELIKDQLDPRHILDTIIQTAIDALKEALITQVAARILLLFNPVGAIAQAIEAIYRVLKWIFENAARIFSLVETVVNGIADILSGNTAGMAQAVELALARLISPVIDFLADYVSLGNLPERIADTVRGLQEWVEGILDRVIGWLAQQARALMQRLGLGREKGEGHLNDTEVGDSIHFSGGGEHHRVWITDNGGQVEVMVASDTPMALPARLTAWEGRIGQLPENQRAQASGLIATVRSQYSITKEEGQQAKQAIQNAQQHPTDPQAVQQATQEDNQAEEAERKLTPELGQLFDLFEGSPPVPDAVFVPGFNSTKSTSFNATYVYQSREGVKNHEEGSQPSRSSIRDAWTVLKDLGLSSAWVKFHIFNENLGGKGVDSNLIPTPRFINNPDYLNRFEVPLKNMYNQHKPIWFEALINYYSDSPLFVSNYLAKGGTMKYDNNNWVKDPSHKVQDYSVSPGKPEQFTIHINEVLNDESYWTYIVNLTPFQSRMLRWLQESRPSGIYSNKNEIIAVINQQNIPNTQKTQLTRIVNNTNIDFSPAVE